MWAWYPRTAVVLPRRARTANSDLILPAWWFCFMSWFTIRNQPSSDDDRRLRQSASIMVATVLTLIVFTVAIVSGVTFVSSFAGPRSAATKSCSPHDEQNEIPRPITINLLGPFAALDARSDRLAVGSRRSRALLACLAMETGD